MEFAASWKPFMKSKASASSTSSIKVVETCPRSMRPWAGSGVLEHDALDDVRDVLALVGGRLERLVDGLELDDLAHVGLLAEQPRDRAAHHLVGFGLELVDLRADLEHGLRVGHRCHQLHGGLYSLRATKHELGELRRLGRHLLNVVQNERLARVLNEVEHIVHERDEPVNVVAVERRDEG